MLLKYSGDQNFSSLLGKDSILQSRFELLLSLFAAFKNLKSNKLITTKRADKGEEVVIMKLNMNRQDYQNNLLDLLSDTETYQKLNKDPHHLSLGTSMES